MAGFPKMVSMELTDEEKLDAIRPYPVADEPDYPWGLRICLTHKELEKLGLDPACAEIGGIVHLHALAEVTSVSMNAGKEDVSCRVELQVTHMEVESEDEEDEEAEAEMERTPVRARRMKALYGGD